jgi:pimeloyl-ACP methyl ester carboxylesterase
MNVKSRQTTANTGDSAAGLRHLRFKTIDGLKIRYATNGATTGTQILLLSPWPESILAYLPTWHAFSPLGSVVAVDLPGFGHSESRPDIMSPEGMGEFIPRILKAFDLHRPHVVGPDIGTPALLYAAANHADLFRSLVIGGGATDHTDIGGILDELVNAPSLEPYGNLTGEQFVQGAIGNMTKHALPDDVLQDYVASYAGDRFFESVKFVRDYPHSLPRLAKRLHEIDLPCQIIVGRDDPYVPVSNAEALRRGLRKSRLYILDCGHFAWEDGSGEYGKLASEWIKGGYAEL